MASRTLLLTLANLLIPVAILIFATGFFPYKPFIPGLATYEELGGDDAFGQGRKEPPRAPFDKLVFMVVDALRSDFVFGEESGMSFVQRYDRSLYLLSRRLCHLLTTIQSDSRRHRHPLHRPRNFPDHHHAARQGHNHRLHSFFRRRDPQLR